jgi:hypothetical protein
MSLAAALLVPVLPPPLAAPAKLVTSVPIGGASILVVGPLSPDEPQPLLTESDSAVFAPANNAVRLRELSQLPVAVLARVLGVSRQAYHDWTRGSNIGDEHRDRLKRVLGAIERIAQQREDVRGFLFEETELGQPLQLLADGREAAAVGLLLQAPAIVHLGSRGRVVSMRRESRTEPAQRDGAQDRLSIKASIDEPQPTDERTEDHFVSIGSFRVG